mmetsp:Transcript_18423/g.35458  ORF Transcript_18423/g.35458 Transcript_18423/m.35458 type:complete len:126 (-) Transcript_18423:91-468(-)
MAEEKKHVFPVKRTKKEWRQQLTKEEYRILRQRGTQAPGCGEYDRAYPKKGYFACKGCDNPLYSVKSKFPDSGWVAFDQCYWSKGECHVGTRRDGAGIEIICNRCAGHLGHVYYGENHTANNERH